MIRDVVLLPSLGRPASDFDALSASLRHAGYRPHAIDPPATAPADATLHDLAAVVAHHLDSNGIDRTHLVGHAFGNRLARTLTADNPSLVASLTLLAAGGYEPVRPDIEMSLHACFDETLSADDHLHHVANAFFAPGNDASVWRDGWMPAVARLQGGAVRRTSRSDWWDAIAPRVLVVQALQDMIAVPANGRRYVADHRDVAALVEIDGAGHAMLPERPDLIADAVVRFLDG